MALPLPTRNKKTHQLHRFNTCIYVRLARNGWHFSECIWKYVSWNGISWHLEYKFTGVFSGDSICRWSTLCHVKIWQRASDEPIFEPMRTLIYVSSGHHVLYAMKQFDWTRLQHMYVCCGIQYVMMFCDNIEKILLQSACFADWS